MDNIRKSITRDVQYSNLSDIKVLKMDIDTNNIYKTKLLSIQKYKLSDLEDLAKKIIFVF